MEQEYTKYYKTIFPYKGKRNIGKVALFYDKGEEKTSMKPCCACDRQTPFVANADHKKYHGLPFCAQCQAKEAGLPFITDTVHFPPEVRYKGKRLPDNIKFGAITQLVDSTHPITRDPEWRPLMVEDAEIHERHGRLKREYWKRREQKEDVDTLKIALNEVEKERTRVWQKLDALLKRWIGQKSVVWERLARVRDWFSGNDNIPLFLLQDMVGVDDQAFEEVVLPRIKELGARVDRGKIFFAGQKDGDAIFDTFNEFFIQLEQAERKQAARGRTPATEKRRWSAIETEVVIRSEFAPETIVGTVVFNDQQGEVTITLGYSDADAIANESILTYIESATGWHPILKKTPISM